MDRMRLAELLRVREALAAKEAVVAASERRWAVAESSNTSNARLAAFEGARSRPILPNYPSSHGPSFRTMLRFGTGPSFGGPIAAEEAPANPMKLQKLAPMHLSVGLPAGARTVRDTHASTNRAGSSLGYLWSTPGMPLSPAVPSDPTPAAEGLRAEAAEEVAAELSRKCDLMKQKYLGLLARVQVCSHALLSMCGAVSAEQVVRTGRGWCRTRA